MKKLFLVSILFLFCVPVFAHETIETGNALIFLHIDPNDDPVPGEPSNLWLSLQNEEKNFEISKCDCVLTISFESKVLLKTLLTKSNDPKLFGVSPVPFVFPSYGKYDVVVVATPIERGTFQPFTANYSLEVSDITPAFEHYHGNYWFVFFQVLGLGFLIFFVHRFVKIKS